MSAFLKMWKAKFIFFEIDLRRSSVQTVQIGLKSSSCSANGRKNLKKQLLLQFEPVAWAWVLSNGAKFS